MTKNKGQTLLELISGVGLIIIFTVYSLKWVYLFAAREWIDLWANEAAICVLKQKSASYCRDLSLQKITPLLKWGQLEQFEIANEASNIKVYYLWSLTPKQQLQNTISVKGY